MKLRFGSFVLDREAGRLLGPDGEVRLRPQAFRMLEALAGHAPRILSQEELLDLVWGVEHISPASVKQAVSEVRQALRDDPARPAIIETVPRRGYRFIAALEPVKEEAIPEMEEAPPPLPAVPPRRRSFRLAAALAVPILGGLSALALVQHSPAETPSRPAQAAPAPASARRSVAILGFKNLSGSPEDEWIASALTEIVGFELAAPGRVRLIPAEEVARAQRELAFPAAESHSSRSLEGIRRNLGTDLVVAGSYLRTHAGGEEKLRLQVLVQDVRTGETVAWARQTGEPDELIDLATAASRGILGSIGGRGPGSSLATFAANHESLRLSSEALARLRVWNAPAALPLLQQAAALDPANPFVQDALTAAYVRLGFHARAKEAARRAMELSRDLPREVRLGIEGRSREVRGEWKEAMEIYSSLWQLHPDDLDAGLRLAWTQTAAGHSDQALETVASLRRLPLPAGNDPRIDTAEYDAAWQLGDFPRCRDAATRAIAEAGRRGALLLAARGRFDRGWALHRLGQADAALADFQVAHDLRSRMGDRGAAAGTLTALAVVFQETGRPAEARKAYERALPVLREIGDRTREAKALNNFAALLGEQRDIAGMTGLLERSLEIKRETGDLQGAALTLTNLGNMLRSRGELAPARARLEEALKINRDLGDAYGTAFTLRGLVRVLIHEGRSEEALATLEEALALSRKSRDADGAAEALQSLGDLTCKAGRLEKAREWYSQALEEFRRLKQPGSMVYPLLSLAEMDEKQKRFAAARARYDQALPLALEAENEFLEAHVRSGLAWTAEKQGDLPRARGENEKALALWIKLGDQEQTAKARQALARLGTAGA